MRAICSFVSRHHCSIRMVGNLLQPTKQEPKEQQPAQKPVAAPLKQPLPFGLEDGTPIKLRLTRNLSSADATTNDEWISRCSKTSK